MTISEAQRFRQDVASKLSVRGSGAAQGGVGRGKGRAGRGRL